MSKKKEYEDFLHMTKKDAWQWICLWAIVHGLVVLAFYLAKIVLG